MTMVDLFTKTKHLAFTKTTLTSQQAVDLFMREVVRHHGVPEMLVHDRDKLFTANFWKGFWQELQTKLGMSTAYHPQTDGQTERENRTMEEIVRAFVNDQTDDWDRLLPTVELAMNSAVQASTGVSPFKMLLRSHCNRVTVDGTHRFTLCDYY